MDQELYNERKQRLVKFYRLNERMPSYDEMVELFAVESKGSIHKYVERFVEDGLVGKTETGRLVPTTKLYGLRVLGTVAAGFPSPAEEELADTMSLDEYLISNPSASFLLTVSGDSMIGAGIIAGDLVIVDRSLSPKSGDIVVAEVDNGWTMKYLLKKNNKVFLRAANPKYPDIHPEEELRIAGVVTSTIRKYQ